MQYGWFQVVSVISWLVSGGLISVQVFLDRFRLFQLFSGGFRQFKVD